MTGRRAPYDVTARSALDRLIRRTAAWQTLRDLRRHYEVWRWYRAGRPSPPPPLVKQAIVKDYARRFALRTLIETGTYRGDMVNACRETFETIVSIELDDVLFEEARRRFPKYPPSPIPSHPVREHVILIDDARCFDGTHDYPTIDELRRAVLNIRPDWLFETANDIIRDHRCT